MKLKVKYSATQKFVINVDNPTLGNAKDAIKQFIKNSYNKELQEPVLISLNGKDPLSGADETTLGSVGIVQGDMLIVLPPSAQKDIKISTETTEGAVSSSANVQKAAASSVNVQKAASSSANMAKNTDTLNMPIIVPKNEVSKTLMEIKDGHPSELLKEIFTKYSPASASQSVNLLVHLTMLECDFHLKDNLDIPNGWKEMVSTFQYSHNSFSSFNCTIVLVTMGDIKQILASFPQQENEISVKVKISEYVKEVSNPIQATNLLRVAQLARTLRDHVLYPLRVAAHQALNIPAPWQLSGLPQEILLVIGSFMKKRDVLNLGQTCHRLHSSMEDNKLWHILFKRDYSDLYEKVANYNLTDWKAKYKEAVNRDKMWKDIREVGTFIVPGTQPPRHPFGPPQPPYPSVPFPNNPFHPDIHPPQPHFPISPFNDPDSPFFSGEIPHPYLPRQPRLPGNPFMPNDPFQPHRQPRNPRGPRFDFI